MNLIKEFYDLKQFLLNTSEVTISLIPLTGFVDRCTKFGVDIVGGNLYYVDEGNMWKLYDPLGIAGALVEYENNAAAIAAGLGEGSRYRLPYNNGAYVIAYVVLPPVIPLFTVSFRVRAVGGERAILFDTSSPVMVTVDWGDGQSSAHVSVGSTILIQHVYQPVAVVTFYDAVFTFDNPEAVIGITANSTLVVNNFINNILNLSLFTKNQSLDISGALMASFLLKVPAELFVAIIKDMPNLTAFDISFEAVSALQQIDLSGNRLPSTAINNVLVKSSEMAVARNSSLNLSLQNQIPLAPPTTVQANQAVNNLIALGSTIFTD